MLTVNITIGSVATNIVIIFILF